MKKIKTEPPDGEIIQVTVPGIYAIISWHDLANQYYYGLNLCSNLYGPIKSR